MNMRTQLQQEVVRDFAETLKISLPGQSTIEWALFKQMASAKIQRLQTKIEILRDPSRPGSPSEKHSKPLGNQKQMQESRHYLFRTSNELGSPVDSD